jgi:hypothetical protein
MDNEFEYDDDIDNTDLHPYPGTCGTLVCPFISRWDKDICIKETEEVRKQATYMGVGVVVTPVSHNGTHPADTEANLTAAGWVKTLTYKGQYNTYNYETHETTAYKMTHWALILKPWEE